MLDLADFNPTWASPPGVTVGHVLTRRGMTVNQFALILGRRADFAESLLRGECEIDEAIARSLQAALGAPAKFWLAREGQYRAALAELRAAEEREWLAELPVKKVIEWGWVHVANAKNASAAFLSFFGVGSVPEWRERYAATLAEASYKTSEKLESKPGAVATWLRKGEIEAANIATARWSREGFRAALPEIRALTRRKNPEHFLPELASRCAAHGVALAVVRGPPGCRASGATRFLSDDKALLLLSCRHLTDDHFWFAFFHEAGHLVLHGRDDLFLEGVGKGGSEKELEANLFAETTLVPLDRQHEFDRLPLDARAIIRFAVDIGVSPGIVVGQLEHRGRVNYAMFRKLKEAYRWSNRD